MIVPDDLVRLEIPALDHLVLTARKQVRVASGHRKPAHSRDVSREREAQLARREVPDLDDAVARTSRKPLVPGLDRNAAYPPEVPGDDTRELPWWVVRRLDCAYCFVE